MQDISLSQFFNLKSKSFLFVKSYSLINKKPSNVAKFVKQLTSNKNFAIRGAKGDSSLNLNDAWGVKTNCVNTLQSLFIINFLKKEKLYTKLKYSRVPQYDSVSGGAAALLAGFLGFLICEKFGFELLDSGDFYFFFMYGVFLIFFAGLLVKTVTAGAYYRYTINFKNL